MKRIRNKKDVGFGSKVQELYLSQMQIACLRATFITMTLIAWATSRIGVNGFVVNDNLGVRYWRRQMPTSWSVNEFDRARIKPTSLSVERFNEVAVKLNGLSVESFGEAVIENDGAGVAIIINEVSANQMNDGAGVAIINSEVSANQMNKGRIVGGVSTDRGSVAGRVSTVSDAPVTRSGPGCNEGCMFDLDTIRTGRAVDHSQ